MPFCKIVDVLYAVVPLRPFRDYLIRRHMETCPLCQARLLSRAEAKGLFVAPDEVGDTEGLWRRISSRMDPAVETQGRRPAPARAGWRWATAAALAAVVAVTGFWLLREVGKPSFDTGSVGPADRFQIEYIKVGGAAAQTFVYQPQGTDTVFVWAGKNL
jgi:hypothetical protein